MTMAKDNKPPFPWLYRGTKQKIEVHKSTGRFQPGGRIPPQNREAEEILEGTQKELFPDRPSPAAMLSAPAAPPPPKPPRRRMVTRQHYAGRWQQQAKPFFFDIETGGLNAEKSSILSISFGDDPRKVRSLYAEPAQGSVLSPWSEKNVWGQIQKIKGARIQSEEAILRQFLGRLESLPAGATVTGWNIGYTPEAYARGFDIPTLISRAEKYGLKTRFQQAFQNTQVRDVGQEFAYRVSKEVFTKYEHLVEQGKLSKEIFGGSKGYAKLGLMVERGDPADTARFLAEEGRWVTGWKQETAYRTLFGKDYQAHLSKADVESGLRLSQRLSRRGVIFRSEAEVVRWGREALYHSLVSQAMKKARPGVVPEEKFPSLIAQAVKMEQSGGEAYKGFSKRVLAGINEGIKERGGEWGDILAGRGVQEGARVWGTKKAPAARPPAVSRVAKFVRRHPGLGVVAGAAALWAAQPGSWFSGKDDEYNTIEGLRHGGEAGKMRQYLTDFGSGWNALRALVRGKETFAQMIKSRGFKNAMRAAQQVKLLDETSMFGKAYLMRGTFRGKQFEFVRKIGEIGPQEVKAMRRIEEGVGPTVYGHRKGMIEMEYFEGSPLRGLSKEELAQVSEKSIAETFGELHKTGFMHGDPHLGNIMQVVTPKGERRLGLIDLGGARRASKQQMAGDIEFALTQRRAKIEGRSQMQALDPFAQSMSGGQGIDPFANVTQDVSLGDVLKNLPDKPPGPTGFSGFDDAHNTIEGLTESGMAAAGRKKKTPFGSGFKGILRLFRGTGKAISKHKAVFGRAKLTPAQNLAEQVLERVRSAEFATRPSRSASTFWTPSFRGAAKYAEEASWGGITGGVVSRTTQNINDVFLTKQTHYTELVKAIGSGNKDKQHWLELARSYWRGVDPKKIKPSEYGDIEALLTGSVASEKAWSVERVLKKGATFDRPAYNFQSLPQEGSMANKITKEITDFGSPAHLRRAVSRNIPKTMNRALWYKKHKEAMVRVGQAAVRPGRRHVHQAGKLVL